MLGATPIENQGTPQSQGTTCPACGNENTADSRFCRHCGAALSANGDGIATATAATTVAPTPLEAPSSSSADGVAGLSASVPSLADTDGQSSHTVSDEIDHRRAQQLIDRAFMLAERGDKPAAILACRQAVALDHNSVSAYSILGLLLEQTGDIPHAIQAYERVLEISPDSLLERESLQRLRASSSQQDTANMFHFDEKELYEDSATVDDATATPPPAVAPIAAASAGALAASAAAAGAAAPTSDASITGATSPVSAPPPLRPSPAGLASLNQPATNRPAPIRPVDFGMSFDDNAGRGPLWWRALQRQPSFYFRGFPLAATTAMSLLFLLWARNWAVSQDQRSRASTTTTSSQVVDSTSGEPVSAPGVGGTAVNNPNRNTTAPSNTTSAATGSTTTNNSDSFSVSSGGAGTAAPGAGPATNNTAGTTANPAAAGGAANTNHPAGANTGNGAPRSVPKFPSVAPHPSAPGSNGNSAANNGGDNSADNLLNTLPPARIDPPVRGSDAVKVLPPDNSHDLGPASGGGALLNPAGSSRGYVRVSPYRVPPAAAPPRGAARASQAERDAAAHPDRAPEILTPSMDSGDVGWNYQSRALSFLERGDYARARDDFQTAINYYHDEIGRGVNVAAARKGLQACEDGRREALARLGH
ncbi:MAG: zinc-ribbon domain-containing protein [Abitibacteriaceae bacterium]|nr:zinc-ribbon domain-containing protein [Abditibacteriaceae bacterium]